MNEELDTLLAAHVSAGIPGVAAAVCDAGGLRYRGSSGVRAAGGAAPMTCDTTASIMSMTKPVTAVAAMQLVEQGRLALDAPVKDVLEPMAEVRVLRGFDADGEPILTPPATDVTLRQLLTHTSGFVYDIWNADCARYLEYSATPGIATGQRASLMQPLLFDPGTQWEYGIGIDWVGWMIETVADMRLADYFREAITEPLGMTQTAFDASPAMNERRAAIHVRNDAGAFEATPMDFTQEREFDAGGGGLLSSVDDYVRFLRMLLGRGELDGVRLLQPDTVATMSRSHIGELRVRPMPSAMPALSADAEFFPGAEKTWGLSFQINENNLATGRPAGGLMWAGLTNCFFWIDPRNAIAGVYLTQTLPFVDPQVIEAYYGFERAVYAGLSAS